MKQFVLGSALLLASFATASSSLLATETTYTYFTCNATSWNPDDQSRLQPLDALGIDWGLEFEVKEGWMVSHGDQCVFQVTNAHNAWGTHNYAQGAYVEGADVQDHSSYEVGQGQVGRLSGSTQFKVKYPETGRYKLRLSRARSAFVIQKLRPECEADVYLNLSRL